MNRSPLAFSLLRCIITSLLRQPSGARRGSGLGWCPWPIRRSAAVLALVAISPILPAPRDAPLAGVLAGALALLFSVRISIPKNCYRSNHLNPATSRNSGRLLNFRILPSSVTLWQFFPYFCHGLCARFCGFTAAACAFPSASSSPAALAGSPENADRNTSFAKKFFPSTGTIMICNLSDRRSAMIF